MAAGADPDPAACGAAYNPAADATQTLSPLLAAASAGRAAAVELLLDAGADPDRAVDVAEARCDGREVRTRASRLECPLSAAAAAGAAACCALLLARGAAPALGPAAGALHAAALGGHEAAALALCAGAAAPGDRAALVGHRGAGGTLPVHAACLRRATAGAALRLVAETAAAGGGLLETADDRGLTPLLQAAAAGLPAVVAALLDAGADGRARDRRGRDAAALAARAPGPAALDVRRLLQDREAAAAHASAPETPARPRAAAEPPATPARGPAKDDATSPALPTYAPTRPPPRPHTDRKKPPPRGGRTVRLLSATPS